MKLVAVLGPTASGKSGLAFELAIRLGAEILCVDATTVYRGLDIGTAKPTAAERAAIPHHLLDLAELEETFSLAEFQRRALEVLHSLKTPAVLVGGSHLYLKALLEGYTLPEAPPDEEFRRLCDTRPLADLVAELGRLDPAALELVDLANPRRVVRALEVLRSGSLFSDSYRKNPLPWPVLKIGLQSELPWLEQRIAGRFEAMLAAGWLDEVRSLAARGYEERLRHLKVIGYPELLDYLEGVCTLEECRERVLRATLQLSKKQRTWYRKEPDVHWLPADSPTIFTEAGDICTQ